MPVLLGSTSILQELRPATPVRRTPTLPQALSVSAAALATLVTKGTQGAVGRAPRAKSASTRNNRTTQRVMRVRLREMFSARQQEQAQLIKIRVVSVTLAQHLRPELWMRVIHLRVSCAQLARTKTCWALLLVLLVRLDLGQSLERIRSLQSGLRERMIFLYVYVHPELKALMTKESYMILHLIMIYHRGMLMLPVLEQLFIILLFHKVVYIITPGTVGYNWFCHQIIIIFRFFSVIHIREGQHICI